MQKTLKFLRQSTKYGFFVLFPLVVLADGLSFFGGAAAVGGLVNFAAGNLSPLFTTSVSNPTTSPVLSFTLSNFGAHQFFGNNTGGSAQPAAVQPNFTDLAGTASFAQLPGGTSSNAGAVKPSSGMGSLVVAASGAFTPGNCKQSSDVNGTDVDSGSPCGAPGGAAGGDLSGTFPNPLVASVGGVSMTLVPSNAVCGGPKGGVPGPFECDLLTQNDIPALDASKIATGVFDNTQLPPPMSIGTKFTASGCSNSSTVGGPSAGKYSSGTTGTCTVTVTIGGGYAAPNGWACVAKDLTTTADQQNQTATTTTSVTISGTTVSGDNIVFSCTGY